MSKYKIRDLAVEVSQRIDNPKTSGYDRFVGLEHYDSGEAIITRYGRTDNLDSSVKEFKSGDILIARRNVYLRRAGLVNFDGVTSGDSIVIRAKNGIVQRLLPFVFNTKEFWDFANQFADGSMSKRLSPKLLMEYETELPDTDEERVKLADLLWSVFDTMASYKDLLRQSDELIKSRFIEMFGDLGEDPFDYGMSTFGKCTIINPKKPKDIADDALVSFVAMPSVSEKGQIDTTITRPYSEVKKGFTYFGNNDVLFAKITPCMENGKGCVATGLSNGVGMGSTEFHVMRPIEGISNSYWIYIATMIRSFRISARKNMTGTGGQLRVPTSFLENFEIALPPIKLQNEFADFVKQIDKSKLILQDNIAKLEAVYKKIMSKYLKKED